MTHLTISPDEKSLAALAADAAERERLSQAQALLDLMSEADRRIDEAYRKGFEAGKAWMKKELSPKCEECKEPVAEGKDICEECCDHDDRDDYCCLICDKELMEDDFSAAFDMAKAQRQDG